eukprot:TRINITY_DN6845_c0_g1_i3.p1 TRINITY_DN6845_c0_g1~~TRINITY_DN6845_c0_g1_i3.p1  ORF type:complete len:991 (+),score=155.60 TRINITY_DN6845_c0_g1_i3:90-2975(+)
MPVTLLLRPLLAVCGLVISAVSLGGGLTLYYSSLDAVSDTVDLGRTALQNALDRSLAAVSETADSAQQSLLVVVDEGSHTQITLFSDEMRQSFHSAELAASVIRDLAIAVLQHASSLTQYSSLMLQQMCTMVRNDIKQNKARVSGLGVHVYDEAGRRCAIPWCWWEPLVSTNDTPSWYGYTGTCRWEGSGTKQATVAPYYAFGSDFKPSSPDPIYSTSADWEAVNVTPSEWMNASWYNLAPGGIWQKPQVWRVPPFGVTQLLNFNLPFVVSAPGTQFDNMYGVADSEVDLHHWDMVVRDSARQYGANTSFVVVDFAHRLVLAHSTDPAPDMVNDPLCKKEEGSGLGFANSSACFSRVDLYSNQTLFVFEVLRDASYGVLVCTCGPRRIHCSEHCVAQAGVGFANLHMRKQHLFTLGGNYVLDALWYRDATPILQKVDQRRLEAERESQQMRAATDEQAQTWQSDAESAIDASLYIMVSSVCVSFLLSAAVAVIMVVLLANPLDVLHRCVTLMGEVRCEEATAEWNARSPCAEVQEITKVGAGVVAANAVLQEYRSFLPVGLFVPRGPGEDASDATLPVARELSDSTSGIWSRNVSMKSGMGARGPSHVSGAGKRAASARASAREEELSEASGEMCAVGPLGIRSPSRHGSPSIGGLSRSPSTRSSPRKIERFSSVSSAKVGASVQTKRISILYLNIVGFHETWIAHPGKVAAEVLAEVAGLALGVASQFRGLLHQQLGDHIIFTFDGVLDCIGHMRKSALAALRCEAAMHPIARVCAGVCTGKASFGAMGPVTARTLTVVGLTMNEAYTCCRAARALAARAVTLRTTYEDLQDAILCRCVAIWSGAKLGGIVPLFEAVEELEGGSSGPAEWMYELEAKEGKNAYGRFNALAVSHCKSLRRAAHAGGGGTGSPKVAHPDDEDLQAAAAAALASVSGDEELVQRLITMLRDAPSHQVDIDIAF